MIDHSDPLSPGEAAEKDTELDARERVIQNIVYAIEGNPLPHPSMASNGIVLRAIRGIEKLKGAAEGRSRAVPSGAAQTIEQLRGIVKTQQEEIERLKATAHEQCHDISCNSGRTGPRGASGIGCSCSGRDAAYAELREAQAEIVTLKCRLQRVLPLAADMTSYVHHSGYPRYDGGHSEPESDCQHPDCVAVRQATGATSCATAPSQENDR